MKKEFVIRGQTPSGGIEKLNFSGHKMGYAYRLMEVQIYPGSALGSGTFEGAISITAGKASVNPLEPDFKNEGLIATGYSMQTSHPTLGAGYYQDSVVNDMFMITQDLILEVRDAAGSTPINWQCRFESVKMSGPEEAVTNYKQFLISDE
jgi:hypothetical protein